jgi:trimethylamine--corrinoid protein Co-methyltransferase
MGSALIALCGGEVCGYLGMLGSSMILYPEQIILEHETCTKALEIFSDYEFDEVSMALDVIAKVGPGGHYLREKHTRKHLRDFRYSPFLWNVGENGNIRMPREVALEEFKKIFETHQPEPLPNPVLNELDHILNAADRTASALGHRHDKTTI